MSQDKKKVAMKELRDFITFWGYEYRTLEMAKMSLSWQTEKMDEMKEEKEEGNLMFLKLFEVCQNHSVPIPEELKQHAEKLKSSNNLTTSAKEDLNIAVKKMADAAWPSPTKAKVKIEEEEYVKPSKEELDLALASVNVNETMASGSSESRWTKIWKENLQKTLAAAAPVVSHGKRKADNSIFAEPNASTPPPSKKAKIQQENYNLEKQKAIPKGYIYLTDEEFNKAVDELKKDMPTPSEMEIYLDCLDI